MVSSSCIIYAFSEILLTERSLVEGQKLQQKEREKRKRESDKKTRKNEKPKVMVCHPNFDWCTCTSEKVVKHDSGEKHAHILRFKGCFE